MAHSYVSLLVHCVFSTKERRRSLRPEIQARVWAFMGGIARQNGMKALAIGGVEDHAHLLLSIPGTMPLAKAVQLVKAGSSKMIHQTFSGGVGFAWQEGYSAFSIGASQVEKTIAYIRDQSKHHKRRTLEEELIAFCKKHGIQYESQSSLRD